MVKTLLGAEQKHGNNSYKNQTNDYFYFTDIVKSKL